jgi:hypothetical protein
LLHNLKNERLRVRQMAVAFSATADWYQPISLI